MVQFWCLQTQVTVLVTLLFLLSILLHSPLNHQRLPRILTPILRQSSKVGNNTLLTRQIYVSGFERPHPELCPFLGAKLRLLILIASQPSNWKARDEIRLTWKHYASRSDISSGFIIGSPSDDLIGQIDEEDKLYNDIIIGRFKDSQLNLTLKTLSMLEWVDAYCPNVPKILKTDDNVYVNVPILIDFIETPSRKNAMKTIWGKVQKNDVVNWAWHMKDFDVAEHFVGKVLPDFAMGPAYLMTTDVVGDMLDAALDKPYLRLEDVFVTGVLGSEVGMRREHSTEFENIHMETMTPCVAKDNIALSTQFYTQFEFWRKLEGGLLDCFDTDSGIY
ncbi:beta-1,3-galactosyltransferase 9 [Amyelois transitella]|uniref:beta-1,3-galactosyltransferase 9 n=1 Tax=Amyelois transitella TaxID=680683 RepID=UPI00298F8B45|nr:beta-1,3-galactosyltransferase 9 [Amyelois transitella]